MINMRTLYLLRHAKSSWDDPTLADIDRPLNKRGLRNAPDMGGRMAQQGHRPELIISSPARRALTTAHIIARDVGLAEDSVQVNPDLYFKGIPGMLSCLREVPDDVLSVMLAGHNPTMTDFLNELVGPGSPNMPTCAIAIVGLAVDSWQVSRQLEGTLLGFDKPKGAGHF